MKIEYRFINITDQNNMNKFAKITGHFVQHKHKYLFGGGMSAVFMSFRFDSKSDSLRARLRLSDELLKLESKQTNPFSSISNLEKIFSEIDNNDDLSRYFRYTSLILLITGMII